MILGYIELGLLAVIVICDTIVFTIQKKTINELEHEVEELRRHKK